MFSEKLERLIQASLQDGTLTEQEKAAIIKRAQAEGEDVDEVDIYIQSLLQKRQQELKTKEDQREAQHEKEKKEAIGKVCPKCGKQVPPLTLVCDCGFEFTNQSQQSAVQVFFDKINNIQLTAEELDACSDAIEEKVGKDYRVVKDANGNVVKEIDESKVKRMKEQKRLEIISSFPIPNTKEDIMEFLALAAPQSVAKGGFLGTRVKRIAIVAILSIPILLISSFIDPLIATKESQKGTFILITVMGLITFGILFVNTFDKKTLKWNDDAKVWRAKFDQVLMKGRSLRADPEFSNMLDYYENMVNQK